MKNSIHHIDCHNVDYDKVRDMSEISIWKSILIYHAF